MPPKAAAATKPQPKAQLQPPVSGASQIKMRAVISKPADAGVKKRAANGDYKKKRRQPLSEEALAKRRAAAQKAAATRKRNPEPAKRRQVKVGVRFDSTLAKKGQATPKMIHHTSGRWVDVGSPEHIAAKSNGSVGLYRYKLLH
jgi:hypothetical protein